MSYEEQNPQPLPGRERRTRRSQWDKATVKLVSMLSGIFLLSVLAGYYIFSPGGLSMLSPQDRELAERLNVLLMAIDSRPGETTGRTDSLILASIDREKKQIYLLSIPRDTRVNIPGHGYDKINSTHVAGGPALTQKVVEDLTGIKLDYYVKTDFNGFKQIVDTLGGVTIDIEKDMYYPGEPGDYINLKKGVQRLDGEKALQYVRFRSDELGDISRTGRQQKFLTALAKETFSAGNLLKLPTLIPQWFKAVETNLPVGDMLSLASLAQDLGSAEIHSMTLPGNFATIDGVSYWWVDPNKAKKEVRDLLMGIVDSQVIDQNTIVPVQKAKTQPAATVPDGSTTGEKVYESPQGTKEPDRPTVQNADPARPAAPAQPPAAGTQPATQPPASPTAPTTDPQKPTGGAPSDPAAGTQPPAHPSEPTVKTPETKTDPSR